MKFSFSLWNAIVPFIYSNSFKLPPHIMTLFLLIALYNNSCVNSLGKRSSESINDKYLSLLILIPLFFEIPEPRLS